ncbi:MAG: dihydrolipoyl dehydrogenase [Candidatus Latescibacteria bacterium]|nr:dihydrolipoyl dehydrogenase [Candidatus Latescibacterota bacterium]
MDGSVSRINEGKKSKVPDEYDIVIIGSGPGGYVGGIRASQLGLKTCVIEKDEPGGVCLNTGCIPTKSLLHQAEIFMSRVELEDMGVDVDIKYFDYQRVFRKSRKAVETLSKGVEYLLKKNNVSFIRGEAALVSKNEVSINDGRIVKGENILIAAGSRPGEIPGFEFDEKYVLSSTGILSLKELPEKLLIIGAGAVGCEFACIMNAFGVETYLVEMEEHILPAEDYETAEVVEKSFRRKKVTVMTKTRPVSMNKNSGKISVTLEKTGSAYEVIEVDKILVAAGRIPNIERIGLENAGITTEHGFIPVGDYYMTKIKGVYAAGDVTGPPFLAHLASKEAEIAVEYMAGRKTEPAVDPDAIPSGIYTAPQIGSFGVTEKKAKEIGVPYKKVVFPYRGIGKAVSVGKTEGIAKVIFDPETKEILGAHIAGENATELIHEILLAKTSGLSPADIASMIHAHPTLSELVPEVMRAVYGRSIHF